MPTALGSNVVKPSSHLTSAKPRWLRSLPFLLVPLAILTSDGHAQVHIDKSATQAAMVSVAPMAMQQAVQATTGTVATLPPATATSPLPPVSQAWTEMLNKIVSDPPPPHLVRGTHYVISNEDRHDLWLPTVLNKGGAYIGVCLLYTSDAADE